MYKPKIEEKVDKTLFKLAKKDPIQYSNIKKKIISICQNPFHSYKFLTGHLQGFNRVHITGNFVLIFKVNHVNKTVEVHYYDHWDNIYKWRPKS